LSVTAEAIAADLLPDPSGLTSSKSFVCVNPLCNCEFTTRGNLMRHY
jgi:hypothetical protein